MRLECLPAPLFFLLAAVTSAGTVVADDGAPPSGLQIEHTNPVTCSRPSRNGDKIAMQYRGRLQSNGVEFDESYKTGRPFVFTLGVGQVIKGWDQGLVDMCPGEMRRLIIPPDLAYGARGAGQDIPPFSTLIFDTEMVDIIGVTQETLSFAPTHATATATEADQIFTIATAPPSPPEKSENLGDLIASPIGDEKIDVDPQEAGEKAECQLLGPFALLVQAALGGLAVLTVVWKRYREVPQRPWKIFFFDVSKQVFGSMLTHVINLAMSMLGSVAIVNAAQKAAEGHAAKSKDGRTPNPCSFYLLNLAIDTTIGVPILYILLKILHALFLRTPLANPPESIKSGNYDRPPRWSWYLKQLLIYCIGLVFMKLFVFFLFEALPWLPWVGDWALRWTKGNEALEIVFAMLIFPLAMNAVQYWIIDNFIMDKNRVDDKKGYEQVHEDDDDDADDSTPTRTTNPRASDGGEEGPLKEANPTPIPSYVKDQQRRGEASNNNSPSKQDDSRR